MDERYEPPSDFLKALINDEVPLVGSEYADANLRRLIEMTCDPHPANRDWATLLLSQQESDTTEIREALLRAAEDEEADVRAEAILGLAQRDRAIALPWVRKELARNSVGRLIFEAAALVAHQSLLEDLRQFASPSDDKDLDEAALVALKACETGVPP